MARWQVVVVLQDISSSSNASTKTRVRCQIRMFLIVLCQRVWGVEFSAVWAKVGIHKPCSRPVFTGVQTDTRVHGWSKDACVHPWTRPVNTGSVYRAWFAEQGEWVSSFLTAHQHILGYLVPYNDEKVIKMWRYNQGYLATTNVK